MKLHLAYDFGGKEVTEEFTLGNKVWAALKSLASKAAALASEIEDRAIVIGTEFYGEIEKLAGKNPRQAFEFLRGKTDDTSEERRNYQRLYASFYQASPRLIEAAKFLGKAGEFAEAKDSSMADAMKLAASKEQENARKEALALAVKVLRIFAAKVADPQAPEDEAVIKDAHDRIRDTIKDYEAALETPRGPMKIVAEAYLLRTAVWALQQVLAGKIKVPAQVPQRDQSEKKAGAVRELTQEEIDAEYNAELETE